MDILTHGLTGLALSTGVAAHSNASVKNKLLIGMSGLIGGVFPDIDVLSRAPGFDSTVGQWFNLQQSGYEIFFNTHWYSHHVFTHSIIGAILFSLLGSLIYFLIARNRNSQASRHLVFYTLAFFLGYMGHLFEDMITPGGPWNGIALFWPSAHFSGGWGKIWWWNNYDLFLIVCLSIVTNTVIILNKYKSKLFTKITLFVALFLFIVQVERRHNDFNAKSQLNKETFSKELQKKYLGTTLYQVMDKLDDLIPIPF
jgi:membrane-bound metal-dependent hydrolase YbcI (DUF457 family)